MNKKIAIIIVNWNGIRFLKDCLDTVYSQTYQNFDVYFVDNGSTDDSVSFVQQYFSRTKIIQLKKNTGFSYANNIGIHTAFLDKNVKFILTLNNDTKMEASCLSHLVETIEQDAQIASVTPKIKYLNDENLIDSVGMMIGRDGGGISRGYREIDNGQYCISSEIFGASACAALFRRESLEDIVLGKEFFDNSFFAYYEDLDLAWRLRLRGWKSWYSSEALVLHVHSGTSISYSPFKAYHVNRNRFFLIIKDFPMRYMIYALVSTPYRYIKLINSMLFKKSGPSHLLLKKTSYMTPFLIVVKGWASFIFHLPFLLIKRYTIQCKKKVSVKDIQTWFDIYTVPMDDMIYK